MEKKVWFFIDIDGCIMPSIFNNNFYKTDKEKLESITQTYKNTLEKEPTLYPEFVDFFKRISSNENYYIEEITFVTGRQENVFGWLTDIQLRPLEAIHWFYVYYFHNNAKHTWEIYKNFKIYSILNSLNYNEFKGIIKIYDDHDFSEAFKEVFNKPFEFNLIKKKEDWNDLE